MITVDMSKIRRYLEDGAGYFLTSVTKNRKPLFSNERDARFLLSVIGYHRYYCSFKLFGYVVMPDHFHILIRPGREYNISKIMKLIKGNFARKYNEIHNRKETVWQQSFYDTGARKAEDIVKWLGYMHYNPVEKGLAKKPEEYEFSSYRQYSDETRYQMQVLIDIPDIL